MWQGVKKFVQFSPWSLGPLKYCELNILQTGNHKGWAYVAFDDPDVAQIAAEAMDGYLMFNQRITCKV